MNNEVNYKWSFQFAMLSTVVPPATHLCNSFPGQSCNSHLSGMTNACQVSRLETEWWNGQGGGGHSRPFSCHPLPSRVGNGRNVQRHVRLGRSDVHGSVAVTSKWQAQGLSPRSCKRNGEHQEDWRARNYVYPLWEKQICISRCNTTSLEITGLSIVQNQHQNLYYLAYSQ